VLFYAFLLQLMLVPPALIVPNLRTVVDLGLYDSLPGVMAPYFASAFGTFLMRQTFLALPRDFEEAAAIDGAPWWAIVWYVLLPMAKPGLLAFAIVSVTAHWNEFLWPLMVISDPKNQTLTIGLAAFTRGAEGGKEWGVLAAGTLLVYDSVARMKTRGHWLSDVIAGTAIGAGTGYFMEKRPQSLIVSTLPGGVFIGYSKRW